MTAKYIYYICAAAIALMGCNRSGYINEDEPDGPVETVTVRVYEYRPAPGQFINDPKSGMPVDLATAEAAAAWAQTQVNKGYAVSLGAFGGYIVMGIGSAIRDNGAGYDFAVYGNAFVNEGGSRNGSNEPGVVFVMQDSNGNGLPDDTWYELQGSEAHQTTTDRKYAVTYYRPSGDAMPVQWTDNRGNSGQVSYIASHHSQSSYYPAWISDDSYTLSGTALAPRNVLDPSTGQWDLPPYAWGYADNMGSDAMRADGRQYNRFRLSDAVDADGNPVRLTHIDFVKVQTAVLTTSGILGELSTEVCGLADL